MENEIVIKAEHVSMSFRMTKEKVDSLKEYFVRFMKGRLDYDTFTALRNINLQVKKGEVVGIIGNNGSGKSTLLKLISGILTPTEGTIMTKGTMSPLIELGAGFDEELTAEENIKLNGLVLGYSKEFISKQRDEIVEFSELKDFMDVPVKNFSSGMKARLGFAIATLVKPEILIIDEILSVGDIGFQNKCENRIRTLMEGGTTVLVVSHSIEQIERLCSRVLWLDHGEITAEGRTLEICGKYKERNK